jgi:hypothetical protein
MNDFFGFLIAHLHGFAWVSIVFSLISLIAPIFSVMAARKMESELRMRINGNKSLHLSTGLDSEGLAKLVKALEKGTPIPPAEGDEHALAEK